jgi:hypothetical protein
MLDIIHYLKQRGKNRSYLVEEEEEEGSERERERE